MPALSPTMTEGNIATWKVKEGESFSAGDVLLEIETDKATMDVEAQEDGVMVKIMQAGGAKEVQVGTRIAVIAEPDDDISSLEIPADKAPAATVESAAPQSEDAPAPEKRSAKSSAGAVAGEVREVKYPLLPSVQALVKHHGLDAATIGQITPTGPSGRLLKGDILAHLGSIRPEAPGDLSALFTQRSHLDLSNIKVAPPKEKAPSPPKPAEEAPAVPASAEVSVPVSMAGVLEVQRKIQGSVGTFLPLSTFISRATEVANEELPPAPHEPTADELFNAVLGIESAQQAGTRGAYVPKISVLRSPLMSRTAAKKADIIDILSAGNKRASPPQPLTVPGLSSETNIFSLEVPRAEEKRAKEFLGRVKLVLEGEPGRLVL